MSCAANPVLTDAHAVAGNGTLDLGSPWPLVHCASLFGARLAYRLSGPSDGPVVLVMGGISAHRQVDGNDGWWAAMVGAGRALDSDFYRVLSFDWLGGCGESTRANGPRFPLIDTLDQASAAIQLLDALGVKRLHAVVGASYGGQVAQQLMRHYPERIDRGLVIGAAQRPNPQALALRGIQRRIVAGGIASGRERESLALARELAMITYRSGEEFIARFGAQAAVADDLEVVHPVAAYLGHCGDKFAERFAPWPYQRLSQSIDLHQVDAGRIAAPFELLGFRSDMLVPPADLEAFQSAAPACRGLTILDSPFGHDGFLKETDQLAPIFRNFLEAPSC